MSSLRGSTLFILIFWAGSMSWLGWTKLRPAATAFRSPQQQDMLPPIAVRLDPVYWKILLNDQRIGWAKHQIERFEDGQGSFDSVVRIDELQFDSFLEHGLGSLGALISRGLATPSPNAMGPLRLTIQNSMRFDAFGQLESFEANVLEDDWGECVRLNGAVRNEQLRLSAYLILDAKTESNLQPVYQNVFRLPHHALLVDSLAPQPNLTNLRVGQRWSFQTYHPFFPTNPLQTIEATVQERRVLRIDGQDRWVYQVAYRRGDDDGLSFERHVGDLYVETDGTVLRQTIVWGRTKLVFERLNDQTYHQLPLSPRLR